MTIPYNTYFPVEQQPPIDFTLQFGIELEWM
jgi:hypothetical protein